MREYCVYIMASRSGVLYVGVTNDLERRVKEHKSGTHGFSGRYGVNRLVYFESTNDVGSAIAREKRIKSWRRDRKRALIRSVNPEWLDLSLG